jgi:hypothetical protein
MLPMSKSTVNYLKAIMPGQPEAWYESIAGDILCGKMPLPKVEGVSVPTATIEPPPIINQARQRFTEPTPEPVAPPRPSSNIPNTVGEALQQATLKPKRPAQPANATTKWKLERMVHGDNKAAARLAAQVSFANPDKSEQWCWEKAICDLARDRH